MVRQIVLSRAYSGKYFYVGSQSTLWMLIKSPNLVESLPCAPCPYYFVSATCTMLQVDLPRGLWLWDSGALASPSCFESFLQVSGFAFPSLLWLAGRSEGSWNHAAVGSDCNGFYLCEIGQLKSLKESVLVNNFFGFHRSFRSPLTSLHIAVVTGSSKFPAWINVKQE